MKHFRTSWWLVALPLGLTLSGGFNKSLLAQGTATETATKATATEAKTEAKAEEKAPEEVKPQEFPQGILFPYSLLDVALNGKVDRDGHVNYLALQNNEALKLFIQAVATADIAKFPVLTRRTKVIDKLGREEEKETPDRSAELVFWINAYNAHILNTITQAYPVSSPDNIPDFDTAKTRRVAGKDYSFAELRKKIVALEPRALFALTDGTLGGPMLKQTAYRLTGLDDILDQNISYFVSNPNNVQLLVINKLANVSSLLQEADPLFTTSRTQKNWAGVRRLLADYSVVGSNKRYFVNNPDVEIKFVRPQRALNRDQNLSPVSGNNSGQ